MGCVKAGWMDARRTRPLSFRHVSGAYDEARSLFFRNASASEVCFEILRKERSGFRQKAPVAKCGSLTPSKRLNLTTDSRVSTIVAD